MMKQSINLMFIALFSFFVSCNTAPDTPKTKEIPEDVVVKGENTPDAEELEKITELEEVDKESTLNLELETLESTLESTAPIRTKNNTEEASDTETPYQKCVRRCNQKMGDSQKSDDILARQKAATANEKCMENCDKLLEVGNKFQECIKNATTEEEKKACRQNYMDNRPWND
ncbi:MAG: hypothetical protein GY810_29185 [Aureispira sp.]|nr:hypothetical protein [Aureispira sp.]